MCSEEPWLVMKEVYRDVSRIVFIIQLSSDFVPGNLAGGRHQALLSQGCPVPTFSTGQELAAGRSLVSVL